MKVLNLYAGIGGNRKLWRDVEVTAVEWDEQTAEVYQDYFPDDEVIIADAHEYLLNHIDEFDFIWSSPPCPSHSKLNYTLNGKNKKKYLRYPDMKLYEEIILLDSWFDGKWVVENVIPYYKPLIPGREIDRHIFWSNFKIPYFKPAKKIPHENASESYLQDLLGFDLSDYNLDNKRKNLRNCVRPETGFHIFNAARDIIVKSNTEQTTLF